MANSSRNPPKPPGPPELPEAARATAPERVATTIEGALLAATAQGDRSAFATLYDRTAERLFRVIYAIVCERAEAEDALQETYLLIWNRAANFDPSIARPIVWLTLLARGKAIDALRRRHSASAAVERLLRLVPPAASTGAERDPDSTAVTTKALASLLPEQREAIMLAFRGGLTSAEIAQARGIPLGTVKTRIRLGMQRLREGLACRMEMSA